MTEEERQVLRDRLEYVRNKMMIYSNTGCAEYLALAKEEKEITDKLALSACTIIKQLEDEDPNRKVTSIKIYRDEYGDKSVLVGFKGKASYESGVIYIKKPSWLQMLIYRIKSLFRKKTDDNGIELYTNPEER